MVYWILRRLVILKFKAQVAMPAPKDFIVCCLVFNRPLKTISQREVCKSELHAEI